MRDDVDIDELLEALRTAFQRAGQVDGARVGEMQGRLDSIQDELRDTEQLMMSAERQASRLASLYAASYQLHSLDPAEVRAAIREISVDLLGAKRSRLLLAYDEDPGTFEVFPLETGGAPVVATDRYTGGDPMIDGALTEGTLQIGPTIAVVPLTMQGSAIGALVIDELLSHRAALGWEDRELLDLLAAHAASALVGARVFQDTQRKLKTLEGLVALLRRPGGAR